MGSQPSHSIERRAGSTEPFEESGYRAPEPVGRGPRVTDEMVRSVLTWARNYEEIESFEKIAESGRKWRVTLREPICVGSGLWMRGEPQEEVPATLIFTSREAMAFAYGCAVGGESKPRAKRREEWHW